jgi:hypothetical protein
VKIKNVGNATYRYQPLYQACFLSFFDSDGREFIIPAGTHCDILSWVPIKPGETKRLFTWDLDECTKDAWGCSRNRPLDPGTYTMQGAFRPWTKGHPGGHAPPSRSRPLRSCRSVTTQAATESSIVVMDKRGKLEHPPLGCGSRYETPIQPTALAAYQPVRDLAGSGRASPSPVRPVRVAILACDLGLYLVVLADRCASRRLLSICRRLLQRRRRLMVEAWTSDLGRLTRAKDPNHHVTASRGVLERSLC